MPIKALYDISWLGLMHAQGQTRSGLGRAIEGTAEALSQSSRCDVRFCATHSPEAYIGALEYVEAGNIVPKDSFLAKPRVAGLLGNAIHSLNRRAEKRPLRSRRPLLPRIAGKALRLAYAGRQLVRRCDLETAQVYHAQYLGVPQWVRRIRKLKQVSTVYDLIPILFPMWCEDGWSEHLATIINGIDPWEHVICISEFTKSDLCNYRQDLDPRKVSVAYLGASEAFRPCNEKDMIAAIRRKYGILDGSYVLAVSNQAPHKNFGMLIESFGKMIHEQNIRDLSLVITGDAGWKRESIMEALSRWNVARRRIVLTGYVPDEELPALYGGAQSFVFPSLYEGFGLPVLEAMQCGTPVISSHASSLPEVVGDAGLLFDPRDSDALSEAMLKIYRSQSLRQELSEKSLRRAKLFSWKRCADDTVSAYERAIRGG